MTHKSAGRAREPEPHRAAHGDRHRESAPEKGAPPVGRLRAGGPPPGSPGVVQRMAGNRAAGRLMTPPHPGPRSTPRPLSPPSTVKVGAAGDAMEREADSVADAVMRATPGTVKAGGAAGEGRPSRPAPPRIMRAGGAAGGTVGTGFTSAMRRMGPGKPLDRVARGFLEPRFGADLGHVRVQSGPEASAMARSISARAFTFRDTIVMGEGQYRPGTRAGRRLLAHEIAHTFQQGAPVKRTFDGGAVDGVRHGGGPVIQREWFTESKTARDEGLELLGDLEAKRWMAALHKYKDQDLAYEATGGLAHQQWVKWFRGTSGKLNTARTEAKTLMGRSTKEKAEGKHLDKVAKVAGDARSADFSHFWGTNHQHSAAMVRKIAYYLVHALPQATLHAAIEGEMLGSATQSQEHPVAVLMMGGSGSGKSRVKALEGVDIGDMVDVDADAVKEALPSYLEMVKEGDRNAAYKHHAESQTVVRSAVTQAIANRQHLLYDATGANKGTYVGGHGPAVFGGTGLFKMLKKQGYEIRVVMVYVPEELAWQRVQSRARETGRYVPEDVTRRIHGEATDNFLRVFAGHRDVDKASIYEAMGPEPLLVWHKDTAGAIGTTEQAKVKERLGLLDETEYLAKYSSNDMEFLTPTGKMGSYKGTSWSRSQTSEAGKLAAQYGLTAAEMAAIFAYTASDFKYMNPAVANNMDWMEGSMGTSRVGTPEKKQKAREEGWMHSRFAIKGLEKLPDWRGNTYRGVGFTPAEIAERYPVGGTTTMEAFTSTSTDRATAAGFASLNTSGDKMGLLVNMQLTKGKDVKPFSNMPREGEILVLPFSTFRVRALRDRTSSGGTRYKEAELEQQS